MEVWEMRHLGEDESLIRDRDNKDKVHLENDTVVKPHITITDNHLLVPVDKEDVPDGPPHGTPHGTRALDTSRRRSSAFPPSDVMAVRAEHGTDHVLLRRTFGHNRYATRKTAAQGMMDMALLLANASQLKSVVQEGMNHPHYDVLMALISMSIGLQILTGIVLLVVGARESKTHDYEEESNKKTNKLNNFSVALVFFITVVNIFITSFGIHGNRPRLTVTGSSSGTDSIEGFGMNST